MTPTSRTLAALRKLGRLAAITERWNPYAGIRQDLFGFVDVVVLADRIVAIQTTSGSNVSARVTKIREQCHAAATAWLRAGGLIEVWGWRQVKVKRGGKAKRWEVRVVNVTTEMLDEQSHVELSGWHQQWQAEVAQGHRGSEDYAD